MDDDLRAPHAAPGQGRTGPGRSPSGKATEKKGAAAPPPVPIARARNPRVEPIFDPEHHPALDEGIRRFNEGLHWEAHEAWEDLWLGLEGDDKVFVQGLIMAAAMLVKYTKRHGLGVYRHYQNVQDRLPQDAPEKWGIDVQGLLDQLEPFAAPFLGKGYESEQDFPLDPATVRLVRNT